jgi:hypothetical protein
MELVKTILVIICCCCFYATVSFQQQQHHYYPISLYYYPQISSWVSTLRSPHLELPNSYKDFNRPGHPELESSFEKILV